MNFDLSSKLNHKPKRRARHKPLNPFPVRLYKMLMSLAERGQDDIISWSPDGASFLVHDTQRLVSEALPAYFNQTKYRSFQRQLNFYGFTRILDGPLEGSYRHPMFHRGNEKMCHSIPRKAELQAQHFSGPQMREHSLPDVNIAKHIQELKQEAEFLKRTHKPQSQYNQIPFENTPSKISMEPIPFELFDLEPTPILCPRPSFKMFPDESSIFSLAPPQLIPQESILFNNGHTTHNFNKPSFFIENDIAPLPLHIAAI